MAVKVLGTEAAMGTSSGNGSNFGNASVVRVINTTANAHLVTLETSAGVALGTFTLAGGASEKVLKGTTDEIFAANAGVKGVAVGFST